jgi:hypothetical protein
VPTGFAAALIVAALIGRRVVAERGVHGFAAVAAPH